LGLQHQQPKTDLTVAPEDGVCNGGSYLTELHFLKLGFDADKLTRRQQHIHEAHWLIHDIKSLPTGGRLSWYNM